MAKGRLCDRERRSHFVSVVFFLHLDMGGRLAGLIPWSEFAATVAMCARALENQCGSVHAAAMIAALASIPETRRLFHKFDPGVRWTPSKVMPVLEQILPEMHWELRQRLERCVEPNRAAFKELLNDPQRFCAPLIPLVAAAPDAVCRCGAAADVQVRTWNVSAAHDHSGAETVIGAECNDCGQRRALAAHNNESSEYWATQARLLQSRP